MLSKVTSFAFSQLTMTKLALLLLTLAVPVSANIVYDNAVIKVTDIFDLVYARDSNVSSTEQTTPEYYCIFRSNWNTDNDPAEYPDLARWGNPLMFSHTNQHVPFIKDKSATAGVKLIAQVSPTQRNVSETTSHFNSPCSFYSGCL